MSVLTAAECCSRSSSTTDAPAGGGQPCVKYVASAASSARCSSAPPASATARSMMRRAAPIFRCADGPALEPYSGLWTLKKSSASRSRAALTGTAAPGATPRGLWWNTPPWAKQSAWRDEGAAPLGYRIAVWQVNQEDIRFREGHQATLAARQSHHRACCVSGMDAVSRYTFFCHHIAGALVAHVEQLVVVVPQRLQGCWEAAACHAAFAMVHGRQNATMPTCSGKGHHSTSPRPTPAKRPTAHWLRGCAPRRRGAMAALRCHWNYDLV